MSNMNTNSEYLHSYIKKVAKNEISNTDTSGVYTGVIKAVLPGHYEVTLNQSDSESTILAIAMSSVDIYEKDDYVYLLRAEISTTINYFIFGKVDAVQETFFNLTDIERFLAEKDSNFSAPDYSTTGNENTIKKDVNNVPTFDKIIDLGYFQFECNINKQGNEDKKPFGFKITFLNEQDTVLEDFIFNSTEFYGQPFAESYISFNSKVFHLKTDINKDAFQKIVISKLEGDEYFTGFSADNVKIVAGSMLEVTAAYQNKITVSNGKNYFDKGENNTGLNNIILTSNVYYNNKKLSVDTLQYYWLLKDDTITEGNESYLEYAGNGWRCLNSVQNISGINTNGNNIEIRLWDNKNNVIQLDKTTNAVNFSSFVNKVKCLVKYFDTFIESDIIDIYNYENEEFSVELSSTTDSKTIAFKNDKIILKCDIINQNDKIDIKNYIKEYRWYLEDLNGDINITPKDKEEKENTNYNTLTIFDSAYVGELEGNQYKFEEGKTQGRFYCTVTLKPKVDAAGLLEKSESVLVDSKAAEVEVTQNIEYKYYIASSHSVIFEETTRTAEDGNTINAGDWLINGDENLDWIGNFFDDEGNSKVFNDLTIFNNGNYDKTEEWFVYYTQRTVWKEGGIIFKTEYWTFPQIARSVIHTTSDGWKNYRIGNSTTQLNTFNQLTNNGTDDGVYYADLGQLTQDEKPDPSKTYYTKDTDGNYKPIQLNITWDFKRDKEGKLEEYYKWDSEEEEYIQVVDVEGQPAAFDNTITYYKKYGDDYRKLEINLNNFKAVNTTWPKNISNPTQEVYENIDNKLFINATYIRSGILEVKDKFYASIDQEDVRIAGFNVNETILESNNETVGLNSNDSQKTNIAIWAGEQKNGTYPFQVTHNGDAIVKGKITATELFIGSGLENFETTYQKDKDETAQEIEEVLNTANIAISDAEEAKQTADTALQKATDNATNIGGLENIITKLSSDTLPATYLKVVPEDSENNMPNGYIAIKSKDDNDSPTDNPGMIFFNTDELVINSDNLKLNYNDNEKKYSKKYFEIDTIPLKLTSDKLEINIAETTFNGKIIAQEVSSDAIRSINYPHMTEDKVSAPTLDNKGVSVGNYIFAKEGAFLDLNKGNLYTPNLLLLGKEGDLILRGTLQNWIRGDTFGDKPNNLKFYILLKPTQVQSTSTSTGGSIHTLFFDNVEIIYPAWWVLRGISGEQLADWTNFENTKAPICHFQNASSFQSEGWVDYSKLEIIQKQQRILVNGEATVASDDWSSPLTSIQINDFNFGFNFDGLDSGSACINLQDQASLAVGWYFSIDEDGYISSSKGSLGLEAFEYNQGKKGNLYLYPSDSKESVFYTVYSGAYFSNSDGKCGLLSQNRYSKENIIDLAKDIFLFAGASIPIWEHNNDNNNKNKWWGDVTHANLKITTNGDLYLTNFPTVRPTGYDPFQSSATIVDWGNLLEERDITYNDEYVKNKIFNFLQMIDVKKVKQKDDSLNKYRFSLTTRELYQAAENSIQISDPDHYFDSDVYACGLTYNYKYKTASGDYSIDAQSIGIRYDEIIAMLVVAAQEELKKQNDLRIVKSGSTSLVQSSSWDSKSISFGTTPLSSVPIIFCSVEHAGNAKDAVYYYRISNVTKNGFDVSWYHNASSGEINLKWIAII